MLQSNAGYRISKRYRLFAQTKVCTFARSDLIGQVREDSQKETKWQPFLVVIVPPTDCIGTKVRPTELLSLLLLQLSKDRGDNFIKLIVGFLGHCFFFSPNFGINRVGQIYHRQ